MSDIAFFVGALLPTFLFAAFFFWVFGRIVQSRIAKAFLANAASLIICGLIYVAIQQTGFSTREMASYVIAQLIWFAVYLIRARSGRKKIQT